MNKKLEALATLRGITVEELKQQLSDMGKKGGKNSKRTLTPEQARAMNAKSLATKRRKKLGSEAEG